MRKIDILLGLKVFCSLAKVCMFGMYLALGEFVLHRSNNYNK